MMLKRKQNKQFKIQQLDDVLEQLQEMNAPLEKAMKAVRSFNEKVLSKK